MNRFKPVISLHGSGESVVLSNGAHADFTLMQGASGLGMRPQEISSVALPSGGSLVQHVRGTEAVIQLPILLGGSARSRWDLRRKLERLCRGEIEVRVSRPNGVYRSRFGHYQAGLDGEYGAGEDSPDGQKIVLEIFCPSGEWKGEEQSPEFRLAGLRKRFLSDGPEKLADGAVLRKETRAPTSADAGNEGDVWLVGENARDEQVLRRNIAQNPVGPRAKSVSNLRGSMGADLSVETQDERRVVAVRRNSEQSGSVYVDQSDNFSPPVGTVIHASLEVKVTKDTNVPLRMTCSSYNGASRTTSATDYRVQSVADGWVKYEITTTVTEMPDGGYFRIIFWPNVGVNTFERGEGYWLRNFLIEYDTTGAFFDGDTSDSANVARRWTGAAGLSVSEEYRPAAGFTASERYKHDGSGWANVGLEKISPFLPVVLASSTVQGEITVDIGGDAPAYPTWIVDGPGTDLVIENDKGEHLKVLTEFSEQVTITTDPLMQDILSESNPDGELWEFVPTNSKFFPLKPGKNRLKVSMVGAKPNSRVRLLYRETYKAGW